MTEDTTPSRVPESDDGLLRVDFDRRLRPSNRPAYLAIIGHYRKLDGGATIGRSRAGSAACAVQERTGPLRAPAPGTWPGRPGDSSRRVTAPEIKGYFRRTRVGRARGFAADGTAALDSRAGETFHCWPSSVMTVTDFLL